LAQVDYRAIQDYTDDDEHHLAPRYVITAPCDTSVKIYSLTYLTPLLVPHKA